MVDLTKIINDPSVALPGIPRAPISDNPFTAGQRFAFNNDREREIREFLRTLEGNNQLRSVLAQRFAAQDASSAQFKDVVSNVGPLSEVFGNVNVADLVGVPSTTGFVPGAQDRLQQQQGADVAFTAAQSVEAGAAGGLQAVPPQELTDVTGFEFKPVTPTSVAAARESAQGITADIFSGLTGARFKGNVPQSALPPDVQGVFPGGNIPGTARAASSAPQITDPKQAKAVETIKRNMVMQGYVAIAPARIETRTSGTGRSVEVYVQRVQDTDGQEFNMIAMPGNDKPLFER